MLLVDGHITHRQDDFIIKCHENHIVPFEFPSHLTHVLQPLNVGVFRPWKHYHKQAIHHALRSLNIEYTISSFFRDLNTIHKQTFRFHTIKNSFKNSGMFPVSYKNAIKKMRYYNNKMTIVSGREPHGGDNHEVHGLGDSSQAIAAEDTVSDLSHCPSTYFESQARIQEWVD
ncbi:hypothetical protein L873DRAFT_1666749 [Choiromyces venosus 120613-1]|uniref:DDE-1 domain-containing protein n=1 Tax=Choiromyces venosus 120613-1 TaxID=1336337 RepID=A0A3N4K555_9PEZI|nr:hypothetical protein L873DRAFT_1666749 [Choiromyces venosus 120613-1]